MDTAGILLDQQGATTVVNPSLFAIATAIKHIQVFLRWLLMNKPGHFGKLTTYILKAKWYWIRKAVQYESDHVYESQDDREMD